MLKKRLLSGATALAMTASMLTGLVAHADSAPIVTIGADLSAEQRQTVLNFFGVTETSVEIIEINNQQERQYLEGKISDAVIGTRTLSCSYIMPTVSGGIVVKTANLTYVTEGMLANALLTCGITDCQVLATAPFAVSGTGALTGVMTAYEASADVQLDEDKKQLATEELILTGDIVSEITAEDGLIFETTADGEVIEATDENGNVIVSTDNPSGVQQITEAQILALLNDIKKEVINGSMSEEKIKEILDKHLEEYRIKLAEDTYNRLVAYLVALSKTDYAESIKEKLSETTKRITDGFDITNIVNIAPVINVDFKTDKGSIEQFFTNIINFIKYLFGGFAKSAEEFGANFEDNANKFGEKAQSIFSNINTDIFQYDEPVDEESNDGDSDVSGDEQPGDNSDDAEVFNPDEASVIDEENGGEVSE